MRNSSKTAQSVLVLLVGPAEDDHRELEHIFSDPAWQAFATRSWHVSRSATLSSALAVLKQHQYPIVMCDRDLQPGSWKDLLEEASLLEHPPFVIVTGRTADERLWAEALNLGAYDVLAKPFYASEVVRVISMASLRWHWEQGPATRNRARAKQPVECS